MITFETAVAALLTVSATLVVARILVDWLT